MPSGVIRCYRTDANDVSATTTITVLGIEEGNERRIHAGQFSAPLDLISGYKLDLLRVSDDLCVRTADVLRLIQQWDEKNLWEDLDDACIGQGDIRSCAQRSA